MTAPAPWTGRWVTDRLGVRLRAPGPLLGPRVSTDLLAAHGPGALGDMLGLALRRNPRRAHLLVSTVLGKHVPREPAVVHDAGLSLGRKVRAVLPRGARAPVVLGYAETATGLGHCVAEALGDAVYLHSTRRPVAGVEPLGGFEEEHSHATSHLLLPEDPALLSGGGPLVLVDDELSTGRTVVNTVRAVHARAPRAHYVVAALVDVRAEADHDALRKAAADLGARIDVVALASGRVDLPDDVLARGQALVAAHEPPAPGPDRDEAGGPPAAPAWRLRPAWPAGVPDGGRHGFTPAHQAALEAALPALGADLAARVTGPRVLVLGCEELMYAPLRLARALADAAPGRLDVRFSTTTRSPVLPVDDLGYAIRTRLVFPDHDDPADGPGERYAYNVAPGRDAARRFDEVVLVVDEPADSPRLYAAHGLLDRLARVTGRVGLVVLPSYRPEAAR